MMTYEVMSLVENLAKLVKAGSLSLDEALSAAAMFGQALLRFEVAKQEESNGD